MSNIEVSLNMQTLTNSGRCECDRCLLGRCELSRCERGRYERGRCVKVGVS